MDRRAFVRTIAATLAAARFDAVAQPVDRVYKVGILRPTAPPKSEDHVSAEFFLPAALGKLGYVEGRNLILEWRYAKGDVQRVPVLAQELVQLRVDVILAIAAAAVLAAKEATATIPIVIFGNFDPVAAGFVTSLARPGRNVTGVLIAPEGTLGAKKLELLKEAAPRARRIAVLASADPSSLKIQLPELRQAANALGVELVVVTVRNDDYADAFARIAATRADALFVVAETYFVRDRRPIIDLAIKYRVPAIWEWAEQVEDGGLMAYGSKLSQRYQRVGDYIDRIFKGANPGDLPVDQPTTFELAINLKTAKAIGLALPQAVVLRADEVFQ
jgi:putative tryptophan/tyrosine transport system substrate-binding protein